jgi:hypothetical protein
MNRWGTLVLVVALAAVAPAALADEAAKSPPPIAMTPSHLLGIKQVLVALVVGLSAFGVAGMILVVAALSPGRVVRAEVALQRGTWRVLLVGVLTTGLLLLAGTLVGKVAEAGAPLLAIVVLLLLVFLAWLVIHGLAATASVVGRNLMGSESDRPWRRVGIGALAVSAPLFVPVLGWLFFLYLACRGTGAAVLALFASSRSPEDSPA